MCSSRGSAAPLAAYTQLQARLRHATFLTRKWFSPPRRRLLFTLKVEADSREARSVARGKTERCLDEAFPQTLRQN